MKVCDSAASDKAPCEMCYNRSRFSFQNSIQVALLVSQPVRLGTDTNLHWKQTVPGQTLDVQNTPQTRAAEIMVKLSAARQGIVAASELDTSEEGGFFAFQVFRLEVD